MQSDKDRKEHVLVCLSSSPSNAKIVETAAKMAEAFGADFTALYVKTPDADRQLDSDRARLEQNTRFAEQLGATVTSVYGDDVSYQIAEFARLSRVTKIVIGRSSVKRRYFWSRPTLTEKLTQIAPNLDVYIIPDVAAEAKRGHSRAIFSPRLLPTLIDFLVMVAVLAIATAVCFLFNEVGLTDANIITVYILGVLITAMLTKSYVCNVISSLTSVLLFNFLFIEPLFTFQASDVGTYFTFAIMLAVSLIIGTLTNRLQYNAKQSAQSAYRTKILFDTNQLLQQQTSEKDALTVVARQLTVLLDRIVVTYGVKDGKVCDGQIFGNSIHGETTLENDVVEWIFANRNTDIAKHFPNAKYRYYFVEINSKLYGIVGVYRTDKPLDSAENSVLQSVLGECALAVDNIRNAEEKERAAVLAQHEQLRANLLRAISHDLRTPLTSISGNADYLLSSYSKLDEATRSQVFADIYDDSIWLISLVENLLSVTRIEDGKVNLNLSCELVDDIIEEALKHVNRKSVNYQITVDVEDKLLLVKVDVKLILQVVINLVDNAIKYTPKGTHIHLSAKRLGNKALICVSDDGEGIPDAAKQRVFDMFYTGDTCIADSRRSLGLGLTLCKSIVNAHGEDITLTDNVPHGSVFAFTLPLGEVTINE